MSLIPNTAKQSKEEEWQGGVRGHIPLPSTGLLDKWISTRLLPKMNCWCTWTLVWHGVCVPFILLHLKSPAFTTGAHVHLSMYSCVGGDGFIPFFTNAPWPMINRGMYCRRAKTFSSCRQTAELKIQDKRKQYSPSFPSQPCSHLSALSRSFCSCRLWL